jgi:transcriptional regulator with XRE-family HTH domain
VVPVGVSVYGDIEALRDLGESIRAERLRRNIGQKRVAELAGISLPTLRKIEHGSGSVEIRHVARILGILGAVERLREVILPPAPPVDARALMREPRQRARSRRVPSP